MKNNNNNVKTFFNLTDWEKGILEKYYPAHEYIKSINQPVTEYFGQNAKHLMSLDFESYQKEIGDLILDQYDDLKIKRLTKIGLVFSEVINFSLICYKVTYQDFHKESFSEIIGYEKMFNIKSEENAK